MILFNNHDKLVKGASGSVELIKLVDQPHFQIYMFNASHFEHIWAFYIIIKCMIYDTLKVWLTATLELFVFYYKFFF